MQAIIEMEPKLTEWDQKSGDGDCGQTFKKGAEAILADLDAYPEDPVSLCQSVARTISYSMGGSSGVLLAIFFSAAAASIKGADLVAGFRGGVDAIMHYGGAKVGSCTMVDALAPAKEGTNLQEIASKATAGAETTRSLRSATHGRSQYLQGSDLTGVPDPGAMAVAAILSALAY